MPPRTVVQASAPSPPDHRAARPELVVRRRDIHFHDPSPGRVAIGIRVTNQGDIRSQTTTASIQAAPLGAFLPWRALTAIEVPSLAAGESLELHAEVARPPRAPLGSPERVTPRGLLAAMGQEEWTRRSRLPDSGPVSPAPIHDRSIGVVDMAVLAAMGDLRALREVTRDIHTLPPDLLELLDQPNRYWAGNLNVFVGERAVERHRATALRIHPGRVNLAMLAVGDERPDAFRFLVSGASAGWRTALFQPRRDLPLERALRDGREIAPGGWIETGGTTLMVLALWPPEDCECGEVDVHVAQRSSGRTELVEFSLDPSAAGAGCYVLDRAG